MQRRDFLRRLGLGLAGAWALGRVSWPAGAPAADPQGPEMCLACLADAHLKDGDERRPEARALARAVAELRRLKPAPQLVLFAGDLAHNGEPRALALGQEILSDLPAPHLMIMGEGDGLPDGAGAWRRWFGDPWFSLTLPENPFSPSPQPSPPLGEREFRNSTTQKSKANLFPITNNEKRKTVLQILGLHTAWCPGGGPAFRVGDAGRRWLARELARLDPEVPLILLSHAPLDPVYRPWQQWTVDGPQLMPLLARFRQVFCLHGHTHNIVASSQLPVASNSNDFGEIFLTEDRKHETENRLLSISLPATAWPGPQALQGTPAHLSPGLGPAGCGWLLLAAGSTSLQFQPQIWQV